jgi:hypothetical protein
MYQLWTFQTIQLQNVSMKKEIKISIFECLYNMFNQFMSLEDSIGNKFCIHMSIMEQIQKFKLLC